VFHHDSADEGAVEGAVEIDPDLVAVLAAITKVWPTLPPNNRAGLRALVNVSE